MRIGRWYWHADLNWPIPADLPTKPAVACTMWHVLGLVFAAQSDGGYGVTLRLILVAFNFGYHGTITGGPDA